MFDDIEGAAAHSLELLDLVTLTFVVFDFSADPVRSGELAFLVAYQDEATSAYGATSRSQRSHSVIIVEANERAAAAVVTRVVQMGYKAVSTDSLASDALLTSKAYRPKAAGAAQTRDPPRWIHCVCSLCRRHCCSLSGTL